MHSTYIMILYFLFSFFLIFFFPSFYWFEIFLDKQTEHKFDTIFLISQMTYFKKQTLIYSLNGQLFFDTQIFPRFLYF